MTLRSATTAMTFAALALLMPVALSAQFTTFVAPPRKAAVDSPKTVAAAKARADSVARMSLTDMKAWVDSAAGVSSKQIASANDTTMATAVATAPEQPTSTSRTTTTFSSGAIAPNTASPLPWYLLAGLTSLIVGMLLFRLRPRRT